MPTLASSNTRHFANASTFADGATLTNLLASGTWTGNATLTSGTTTVTGVSASTPITMSGVISGAGGITKTGANTLTLSNIDTRTGDLQKVWCTHIPGAKSQGETLDEVRGNLREAVQLVLEANRELAEQALIGQKVEREPFEIAFGG